MLLHLILSSVALWPDVRRGLALHIFGIQRGDRGKRLTGQPSAYRGVRPPDADRLTRLRPARRRGEGR